jgi:uncharacterized membrane protein
VVERLFELLFKYRPVVFERGELTVASPWPIAACLLALAAGLAVVWAYLRLGSAGIRRRRPIFLALRLAVLALILFSLLRPELIVRAIEPQRNFLAVVVDDSLSMTVADRDNVPRSAFVRDALGPQGPLRQALGSRFALRFFGFASSTDRVADPQALTFSGTRSHVGQALERAARELAGLPVSGVVLVTDGADTSEAPIADALRSLKAAGLPVFTVGLGREAFARDVQLGRVEPPARVLKGATVVADVVIAQTGYAGRTVPIVVEDEGRLVGSQDVRLPPDGEPATVRVRFTLADPGPRLLRFRLPQLDGEQVTRNNARDALVSVVDRREKVLYIEGEPRFEMKFLRRAVADDRNLQVVTLQRTADRKFLRLDVDAPDDLLGGFPKTREELFAYRGLILGSIEASAFTPDQLRMIADFVSLRGGGLLALGGRHAFVEGGYGGTPVGETLPVLLDGAKAGDGFLEAVNVRPTRLGETHIATQIGATEEASADRWKTLPALTAVNRVRGVKPGAAVLLAGGTLSRQGQVVLAYQRYGAGKALALPVQDSWLWQMHADVRVDDSTHETLWRRLVRWLVDGVPERVETAVDHERVEPGDTIAVAATVRDARFLPVNDATVRAQVIAPSGRSVELPLDFAVDRDGEYRASLAAGENGLYEVRVEAMRERESLGGGRAYVRAAPGDSEYFDAAMRARLLKRIAAETGGRFYTPASVASLPDDITYLGRGVTVVQEKELWDMPAILLLIVLLAGGEWFLRRRWGLA